MKRSHINWLVDVLLFASVFGLLLTGLLIEFILPPGSRGDAVWSLTRHAWGDVHFWFAVSMLAIALLHVVLHWGWVCTISMKLLNRSAAAPRRSRRNLAGATVIMSLLLITGGFLFAATRAKTVAAYGDGPGSAQRHDDHQSHLPQQRQRRGW